MTAPALPPVGPDLRVWAQQLTRALLRGLVRLNFLSSSDTPSENGIILWDEANGYPVVSRGSAFRQILISEAIRTSASADQTIAAGSFVILDYDTTQYATSTGGFSVSTDGRITVNRAGKYAITGGVVIEAAVGALDSATLIITRNADAIAGQRVTTNVAVGEAFPLSSACAIELEEGDVVDCRLLVNQVVSGVGNGLARRLAVILGVNATQANYLTLNRVG